MPLTIKQHLEYLSNIGTDRVAHRNGTLLKHLQGTWGLLREWQNPEPVCLAGLYHSVYSTGGFEQQLIPLNNRHEIVNNIGIDAERLVYLFGACDRPLTHPRIGNEKPLNFHDRFTNTDYPLEEKEWCGLCEVMIANEIDLGTYDPAFYNKHLKHYADLFVRFEPWLSEAAINARYDLEQGLAV